MKVALGSKIKNSAWGGGNNFVKNLSHFLLKKGVKVCYDLKDKDIDIILLTDPRVESSSSTFNHYDISNYLRKKPFTLVCHRINECDQRKGTNHVNDQLAFANRFCDFTIFISEWLQNIFVKKINKETYVILNGANKKDFYFGSQKYENGPVKIVTHHWSSHKNKGFDIYKLIDDKLNLDEYKNKVEFTIIGNICKDYNFINTKLIKPLHGKKLTEALNSNHIYITGSINEPGGNHQNEAINCGLPVLYFDSGCMKEYCEGYGQEYDKSNLFEKIDELKSQQSFFRDKCKSYKFDSELMCNKYYDLFKQMLDKKDYIVKNRQLPKISIFKKYNYFIRKIFI